MRWLLLSSTGILADNLLDAADAARRVVDAFCSGARLHRISEIYDDDYPEIECDLHASYQQIIHSRPAYEAAVSAASWEEWELRRGGDWEPFRDVGIHMRRFVYSVCQPLLPAAPPARRQRSVSPALAPPSPPRAGRLPRRVRAPPAAGRGRLLARPLQCALPRPAGRPEPRPASPRPHPSARTGALLAGPLTELILAISALLRSLAATAPRSRAPRSLTPSPDSSLPP